MHPTWQKGDRVLAWWESGQFLWYPGTIADVEAERYHVQFDDGAASWVPADQLLPLEVNEGSRVQCRWKGGAAWYSGTVDGKDGSRIHIAYDDGDQEWTTADLVRRGGSVPPSARGNLVWSNPKATKGTPSVVRLSPQALSLAMPPKVDVAQFGAAAADGENVPREVIPLTALVRLEGDADGAELTVRFYSEQRELDSLTVPFSDPGAREGFLEALREQLGSGWRRGRQKRRQGSDGLWLLGGIAFVALITWLMYSEAGEIAAGRKPQVKGGGGRIRLLRWIAQGIEQAIGQTGVLIVGGILIAILIGMGVLWFFGLRGFGRAVTTLVPAQETESA
jgi:hypothetical protein